MTATLTTRAGTVPAPGVGILDVSNPYSGETVSNVPVCGPADVDAACATARAVLESTDLPLHRRAATLDTAARLVGQQAGAWHTRLRREEVFGPVVVLEPYQHLDEALELANDTNLAIHAGIYTRDIDVAMRAVRRLSFAGVYVNEVPTTRLDLAAYGGVREAGTTREGPDYAIREMTEFRLVSLPAAG